MTLTSAVSGLLAIVGSVAALAVPAVRPIDRGDVGAPRAIPTDTRAYAPVGVGPAQGAGSWAWPLDPRLELERRFDPPDQRWLPGHRGVDLRAGVGQAVRSPAAGTVTFSGALAGRGVVVVSHADGLRSTFEPVAKGPGVGARVGQAQSIGVVTAEDGHCAPRTCLHWGVLRGRTYLDPLSFLGRPPIILLPLD